MLAIMKESAGNVVGVPATGMLRTNVQTSQMRWGEDDAPVI